MKARSLMVLPVLIVLVWAGCAVASAVDQCGGLDETLVWLKNSIERSAHIDCSRWNNDEWCDTSVSYQFNYDGTRIELCRSVTGIDSAGSVVAILKVSTTADLKDLDPGAAVVRVSEFQSFSGKQYLVELRARGGRKVITENQETSVLGRSSRPRQQQAASLGGFGFHDAELAHRVAEAFKRAITLSQTNR